MVNASCVQGAAAFNMRETSTSVQAFAHFDAQDARLHTVLVKYAPYQMQVLRARARARALSLSLCLSMIHDAQVYADNMLRPRMRFPLRMTDAVKASAGTHSQKSTFYVPYAGNLPGL